MNLSFLTPKSTNLIKEKTMKTIIEFCYKWSSGRIEVRYRRDKGSKEANFLINEYDRVKMYENCPYFYREISPNKANNT